MKQSTARVGNCRNERNVPGRAADVLNTGKTVAILVGAGALSATDEVIAVAQRLEAGVAKALLGKGVLPDDLPWVTGSIGLLDTKPSWELMTGCDTLLMIGSGFPYSEFLPQEGQARGVQIDLAPEMPSLRYPMEVNLVGDSAETLHALLPLLDQKRDCSCANWYARDIKIRRGMMCSLSGSLASMGAAVPYAIAAKIAHPDRPVIALVGDGIMQMNNMAELITIAKYWREWPNPTLVVCVFNNQDLNQVT